LRLPAPRAALPKSGQFANINQTMSAGMFEETGDVSVCRTGWPDVMSPITANPPSRYSGAACRAVATAFLPFLAIIVFYVTSCATISSHQFSEPTSDWQSKTGQLMYRTPNTTLIGEALVRFSKAGDFELTVSKGPGITLLSVRQDATNAEVKGGLARQGWSGPVGQAPPQLRGWLGLRDQFLHTPDRKTLRYTAGNETFVFRF
jgi:hypothetical protein